MLDDIPQAYMACTCLALRPKKEPGDSNRDISGLIDGQAYMSEAKSSSKTPSFVVDGGQDMVEVIAPKWKGRLMTSYRETDIRGAH